MRFSAPPHRHDQADDHEPEPDQEVPGVEVGHPGDLVVGQVVHQQPGEPGQHETEHDHDIPDRGRSALDLHRGAAGGVDRVIGLLADLRLGHDVLVFGVQVVPAGACARRRPALPVCTQAIPAGYTCASRTVVIGPPGYSPRPRAGPPRRLSVMRVLVVDNYDSFVFNLVQYLGQLGVEATVWRNDDPHLADADRVVTEFDGLLISPGP